MQTKLSIQARRRTLRLLLALIVALSMRLDAQQTVTCRSAGRMKTYCPLPPQGAAVLQRRLSAAPCVRGRSWGIDKRGLWVSRGCEAVFTINNPDLGNPSGPGWWHPGPGNPAMWPPSGNWHGGNWARGGACFYKSTNFRGDFFCMRRGENYPTLGNFGDQISSLRVYGGARVVVYNDRNFTGGQSTMPFDVPNLKSLRFPNDPSHTWNNRISSIQVR